MKWNCVYVRDRVYRGKDRETAKERDCASTSISGKRNRRNTITGHLNCSHELNIFFRPCRLRLFYIVCSARSFFSLCCIFVSACFIGIPPESGAHRRPRGYGNWLTKKKLTETHTQIYSEWETETKIVEASLCVVCKELELVWFVHLCRFSFVAFIPKIKSTASKEPKISKA